MARAFLVERAGTLSDLETAAIGRYLVDREREVARLRRGVGPPGGAFPASRSGAGSGGRSPASNARHLQHRSGGRGIALTGVAHVSVDRHDDPIPGPSSSASACGAWGCVVRPGPWPAPRNWPAPLLPRGASGCSA